MFPISPRSRDHRRAAALRVLIAIVLAALLLSACDWPAYRFGADRTGYNPSENQISVSNVSGLHQRIDAPIPGIPGAHFNILGSPVVANHVAYVGSPNGVLYAFDASGTTNCAGTPNSCAPVWSAATSNFLETTPMVANGVVYVVSADGILSAFDANGVTGCSGSPKTCAPLWTANTGGSATYLVS